MHQLNITAESLDLFICCKYAAFLVREMLFDRTFHPLTTPVCFRFGRPAGEKRVYFDLAKKPTGAANLSI
jgi:hypothetical protein